MKKDKNYTSMLGLAVELLAVILMAVYFFTGKIIPRPLFYLFLGGFLITLAGSFLSGKKK